MWRPQTPPLQKEDLADPLVAIHFWAVWNSYDRQMDKLLAELQPEFEATLKFRSLDIDDPESRPISVDAKILNVPALGLFANGQHVDTQIGLRDKEFWQNTLEEWSRFSK